MKNILIFIFVLIGVFAVQTSMVISAYGNCETSDVRLEYMSQRWLSAKELAQFDDLFGISLAIKFRLVNDSDCTIYFLSDKNFIRPRGYQKYRKNRSSEWDYLPPSRGRDGTPGTEFTSTTSVFLGLLPNSVIEYETFDWSKSEEEHAFTTFIKFRVDGEPKEISSKSFFPLTK